MATEHLSPGLRFGMLLRKAANSTVNGLTVAAGATKQFVLTLNEVKEGWKTQGVLENLANKPKT